MTVQTLRGTRSFPDGRGTFSRRSLLARRRAGTGDDGRGRRARVRGRARPRARAVLERVGRRLHLIPRYRQRLQSPAPGVTNPVWIDDDQFDLGWHVRRAALPAPGATSWPSSSATRCRAPGPLAAAVGAHRRRGRRRASASPCWRRCTTPWSTASRRSTSAPSCSTRPRSRWTCRRPTGRWEARPYDRARHSRGCRRRRSRPSSCWSRRAARAAATDPAPGRHRPAPRHRPRRRARAHAPAGADDAAQPPDRPQPPLRHRAGAAAGAQGASKAHGGTVNDGILAVVTGACGAPRRRPAGRPPVALVPVSVRRDRRGGRQPDLHRARRPADARARPGARMRDRRAMRELKDRPPCAPARCSSAPAAGRRRWSPPRSPAP